MQLLKLPLLPANIERLDTKPVAEHVARAGGY
jgi:hypothetical protein